MQYPRLVFCAAGLVAGLAITPALAAPRNHAQAAATCWQGLTRGQAVSARSACDAALQLGEREAIDLLRLGHADWLAGHRDAALMRYRQALATHPDPSAWRDGPMRELDRLIARGGPAAATWREARAWLDEGRRTLAQARADLAAARQLAHDRQIDAALPLARRAFDAVDPLAELASPDRLAALDQLLALQEEAFRYDELLAFSRTQLARLEEAGGRHADLEDRVVGGEATALHALGRHREAAEAWQRAIEIAQGLDGAEETDLVWLLNARADALLEAGDAPAARAVLTRAASLLGPKATIRVAAETFGLLARCLQAQGLPDDALLAAQNALQLANHVAEEEPAAAARALAELADVQAAQAHYAEAISLNRQAVALAESTLGAAHPFTSRRMERFALALAAGGQPVGATMWLERSLELGERTLGPDHPESVARRERLAEWQGAADEPGEDTASAPSS
jgi:tetratricopeptide (TPR) repeat protein